MQHKTATTNACFRAWIAVVFKIAVIFISLGFNTLEKDFGKLRFLVESIWTQALSFRLETY